MRSKIIVVNAGIVILVALLSYVLLSTQIKNVISDPAERKHEVERSLRAANAQLALDGLRRERRLPAPTARLSLGARPFERRHEKPIASDATRGVFGPPPPEARQQAGLS